MLVNICGLIERARQILELVCMHFWNHRGCSSDPRTCLRTLLGSSSMLVNIFEFIERVLLTLDYACEDFLSQNAARPTLEHVCERP